MRSPEEAKKLEILDKALEGICKERCLEIVEALFHCITQDPPGSFRRLIYERLGFDHSCYEPLYSAGGMTITNALASDSYYE